MARSGLFAPRPIKSGNPARRTARSILHNAMAELPEADHPARKLIQEYKKREHKRIRCLCEAAEFQNPELAANLFYMMLEGATNCVQCVGTKQIAEHLIQLVDLMI